MIRLAILSLPIAINRSALQIASILITAVLGHINPEILAQVSLALAASSILFVAVSVIQLSVQSDFAYAVEKSDQEQLSKLFFATTFLVTSLCLFLALFVLFFIEPFKKISEPALREGATAGLYMLLWSLPLVAWTTLIGNFLEASGYASLVSKMRIAQVIIQVVLVTLIARNIAALEPGSYIKFIMIGYVATDFLGFLSLLLLGIKKGSLRKIRCIRPDLSLIFNTIRSGGSLVAGFCGQKYVFFILTATIATIGSIHSAAFAILNSVTFLITIPLLGWAHASTIEIGRARGTQNNKNISITLRNAIVGAFFFLFCTVSLLFFLKKFIFSFFTTETSIIMALDSLGLSLYAFVFINGTLLFLMAALRGYADNFIPQISLVLILLIGYTFLKNFSTEISFSGEMWHFIIVCCIGSFFLFYRLTQTHKAISHRNP